MKGNACQTPAAPPNKLTIGDKIKTKITSDDATLHWVKPNKNGKESVPSPSTPPNQDQHGQKSPNTQHYFFFARGTAVCAPCTSHWKIEGMHRSKGKTKTTKNQTKPTKNTTTTQKPTTTKNTKTTRSLCSEWNENRISPHLRVGFLFFFADSRLLLLLRSAPPSLLSSLN